MGVNVDDYTILRSQPMSTLTKLQNWFQQQCDGEWEHRYGLTLRSTDNPGWWVTIDLRGTALEQQTFVPIMRGDFANGNPQPPWLHCYVKD